MEWGTAERDDSALPSSNQREFEAFVRGQRETLVGFLRRRLPSEDDAQDIAQESLVRLMRYRGQPPEAWTALLYRIALNAINDRARRALTHHDARHVSLDDGMAELMSPEPTQEQRLATQQQLALLQRALLALPTRCREVYLLNRIEGLSYTEIARHCGISVKAVEKHIGKALALLRRSLAATDTETSRP